VSALPYLFSGEIDGEKIPWSSGVFSSSTETIVYVMMLCTKEEFVRNDHGGAVYSLSPESFSSVPQRKDYEWYCEEKVKPFEKKEYDSILTTWEAHNMTPFFLTQEQFEHARTLTGKERVKYLKSL
jgi:hypothetical protein